MLQIDISTIKECMPHKLVMRKDEAVVAYASRVVELIRACASEMVISTCIDSSPL